MPQHRGVQAERQRGGVDVLAFQLGERVLQGGQLGGAGAQQRGLVVAVETGRLDGRARQETGLHDQDGAAVAVGAGEAVHLTGADPQDVARGRLVLGEVDHVPDRAFVEEHHDVEVDAVHAVQRGVHVPDASGPHRADLHADAGQAQIDREGEGPDPVPGPAFAPAPPWVVLSVMSLSRRLAPALRVPFSPKADTRAPSPAKVRLLVLKAFHQRFPIQ